MSRLFDSSAKYATATVNAQAGIGHIGQRIPSTGTFVVWLYPLNSQNDSAQHQYVQAYAAGSKELSIWKWSDNKLYVGWYPAADYRIIMNAGAYTFTQNAWNCLVYTWISGGYSYLWLNGSNIGNRATTNIWTDQPTAFRFGTGGTNPNARMGHWTFWNRVLTSAEIAALNAGILPTSITDGLVMHWPMTGIHSAEPQTIHIYHDLEMALSGSPAAAAEPPLIYGPLNAAWDSSASYEKEIRVAKAQGQAVLAGPQGAVVAKAQGQAVLRTGAGVNVAKAQGQAVLESPLQVSQNSLDVIFADETSPEVRVTQVILRAIVSVTSEWSFDETGEIVLDGETDYEFVPAPEQQTWEFAEAGDVVLDGEVNVSTETGHDETGDIVIDGEVTFDPQINVDIRVTQASLEALATVAPDIQVTQAGAEVAATVNAEILVDQANAEPLARYNSEHLVDQVLAEAARRENAEILVDQVLCEVLISRQHYADFMPTLAAYMG